MTDMIPYKEIWKLLFLTTLYMPLLTKLLSIKLLCTHCLFIALQVRIWLIQQLVLLYFSSSGSSSADPTALYQLRDDNLKLGDADADISMSPDGTTLLIADNQEDRVFFLDTRDGVFKKLVGRKASLYTLL